MVKKVESQKVPGQAWRSQISTTQILTFGLGTLILLFPWISAGIALLAGILLALFLGKPLGKPYQEWAHRLLKLSIIGLGAGMNLKTVQEVGFHGVGMTVLGISITLILGLTLGRLLKMGQELALLISAGTAICGGSAIAAVAATIQAKPTDVSLALAIVFILNAVGLFIFPPIGHYVGLGHYQFGLWSAMAIHDTSSVVGAAMQYGERALEVATPVKLTRALWIIPFSLATNFVWNARNKERSGAAPKKPWFILGFLVASAVVSWIPLLQPAGLWVSQLAKRSLVLALFFLGGGLSMSSVRAVGFAPLFQGVVLWIAMASAFLVGILNGAF